MVYFVGAGPGAPDLITVRGQRLLEQADVIIYAGSLVNPALLEAAKPSCTIRNSACMTLEEVISVMEAAQQKGKVCVRLHTGDPSLYGAVREQMDELDKRGIPYESCPGVSAMFGAAAAMNLEYTLPGVSQTLIISRSSGRTPVPRRESIRNLAAHRSTMVLYLSAGQMAQLSEELIAGGYAPETPAAIVYKATWPEELCLRCTVSDLAEKARENNISKTALVIVGDVLEGGGERSRLYDPSFSTGYRKAEKEEMPDKRAAVISFTREGTNLGVRIADRLAQEGWRCRAYTTREAPAAGIHEAPAAGIPAAVPGDGLREWTKSRFQDCRAILFVGAAGIAVRLIAPFVKDKMTDPAVLVIDETAKHVIPLLSGHVGGANRLARQLSEYLGADCVLTTATDLHKSFAVDCFAKDNGLIITDREKAKAVSAAVLAGETIRISGPEGWLQEAELPAQLEPDAGGRGRSITPAPVRVRIDWRCSRQEEDLRLIPGKSVWIGAGCKKGTSRDALEEGFEAFLRKYRIDRRAIAGIASISMKSEEAGLLEFAAAQALPLRFYDAEKLETLEGEFSESAFVRQQTGTGNVCERAACLAAGEDSDSLTAEKPLQGKPAARLIVKKQSFGGITFAAALTGRRIRFE